MTADNQFGLYGEIAKFDADGESLLVSGILSSPNPDRQGEVVEPEAMRKALGDFLVNGTSREMHSKIAAGRPIAAHVDETGNTHVTVKVVDKGTIQKIKEKVLRGFSIGGHALKKIGNRITELQLIDASIVDRPANPDCVFSIVKFDKPEDKCSDPQCKNHHESATEKCDFCKSQMEKCDDAGCAHFSKGHAGKCSVCQAKISKSQNHDSMSQEAIQKLDDLAKTVETLVKGMEAITKSQPDIAKLQTTVSDLEKRATDAATQIANAEKTTLIEKMQSEGRVCFNESGAAYKPEELQKMDLPMLKFASRNSVVLPTQARAVYQSAGDGPKELLDKAGKPLTGSARIEKAWESRYGDLGKMLATPIGFQPNAN